MLDLEEHIDIKEIRKNNKMSLKKFYKELGITPSPEEEKIKFVQRINQTIFNVLKRNAYPDSYESIFIDVCYQAGVNSDDILRDANHWSSGYDTIIPHFRKLTGDSFEETLKILVLLYNSTSTENKHKLNSAVESALAMSAVDLGVRWKDGMFYPSGAKELDDKLISDNLDWLKEYPDSKAFFKTSLEHFSGSLQDASARKDSITNSYSSIEDLAQKLLNNKNNFEKNSNDVVVKLGLPKEYKNIIHYYKQIAHEYGSRHAGSDFSHEETEAFIYMTGILIRLIIQKNNG